MMINLGIIGPKDTVDKIVEIAEEFKNKINIKKYIYKVKEDLLDFMDDVNSAVDVILFSGPAPYYLAASLNLIKKPSLYIPRVGTAIFATLLEAYQSGIDLSRISVDYVDEESVKEVYKEFNIIYEKIYALSLKNEDIKYDELVKYHYNLWKKGKTNMAITGLSQTYEKLKELNVPVFRLKPTIFLIREYVNKAIYIADVKKIQETSIAIQIVKIKNKNNNMSSEYNFLKIKNKIEEALIDYTKEILGSIFPFGRDEYMIFTTRGAIANSYKLDFQNLNGILKDVTFASGIGYGNTVYNSEFNARIALNFAMDKPYSCLYIVDENGSIEGPISKWEDDKISYDLLVSDERIKKIADDINISPSYVTKIMAIMERASKNVFDAEELANYLEISTRSARRILNNIVNANYGKIIAKENKSKTGRPRQIYEINKELLYKNS